MRSGRAEGEGESVTPTPRRPRGYFGVAIYNPQVSTNVGTLWRSASITGAAFMATIFKQYKLQSSDTLKSWKHTPL